MINILRRASCGRAEEKARGWDPRTLPPCFSSSRPWSKGGAPNRPPPFQAPLLPFPLSKGGAPNRPPPFQSPLLPAASASIDGNRFTALPSIDALTALGNTINLTYIKLLFLLFRSTSISQTALLANRASVPALNAKRFRASLVVLVSRLLICCTIHHADQASVPALNAKRFHASLVVLSNRANKYRTWSVF